MKKISGFLIVAMIAFTMMGGVAFAGTLVLDPAGSLSYPAEAAVRSNIQINLNDGAPANVPAGVVPNSGSAIRQIIYTPTTDLPGTVRIVFTLTNARFVTGVSYYLLNGAATAASTDDVQGNSLTFVVGDAMIPANTALVLSRTQVTPTNPTIILGSSTATPTALATPNTSVTLQVTGCFDAVGTINGGLTNAVTVLSSYQQYSFYVDPVTATIDVEPESFRRWFVEGTDNVYANIGLINAAGSSSSQTWRISLNSMADGAATLKWTLTGAQLNKLDTLQFNANNGGGDWNFNISSDALATLNIDANDDWTIHDTYYDQLWMSVNQVNVLNTQTFNLAGMLDFANNSDFTDVTRSAYLAVTWDINGWQGTVPYMYATSVAAEDTFIKIFNNSTIDAEVYADITPDAGGTVPNVTVGNIPAGTVGLFWARDMATAAGLTMPGSFAAVFTVNAPKSFVSAMANQKRPGGVDRVIPVYTGPERFYQYKHW